jgi:Ni/Fe-hydrogenase 1 B-type cytochrome subunit
VEKIVQGIKEWSVAMRINHWASGSFDIHIDCDRFLYCRSVYDIQREKLYTSFFMGNVRFVHILFGTFLIFLSIWRLYLAFFSRFHADWRDFLAWTDVKPQSSRLNFIC